MLGLGLPSIEPAIWALLFVMIRVGAAFVAAPVFGAMQVPVQVRILLSGAIAVLAMQAKGIEPPTAIFALTTFLMVAQEALVGLAMGFILQIAFAAPLLAGEAISGAMGLSFATAVDPQNGAASQAVGQFMSVVMTLLFLSLDGHLILTDLIVRSYDALPPGDAWLGAARVKSIAMFGSYAFMAGLLLALPVGFTLLSLNLFAVGLPASLITGLLALAIAFPAMGDFMTGIVREGLTASQNLVFG